MGVQDHSDRAGRVHIKHLNGFIGATAQNYVCTIRQGDDEWHLPVKSRNYVIGLIKSNTCSQHLLQG